jgi:hypothetical protein
MRKYFIDKIEAELAQARADFQHAYLRYTQAENNFQDILQEMSKSLNYIQMCEQALADLKANNDD